jgi:iron(III) transport system permease protein
MPSNREDKSFRFVSRWKICANCVIDTRIRVKRTRPLNSSLPRSSRKSTLAHYLAYALLATLALLPFAALVYKAFGFGESAAEQSASVVQHYASTVLPRYLANSAFLAIAVAFFASVIGVACAWQIERYEFPGRRFFSWALLLPMAMPAYVAAYVLTDYFQFSGPIQSGLRSIFNWQRDDYWFPEIASLNGAIFVFSITLYPYVFLLARVAFAERGTELFEAARTLGLSRARAWWRAVLPMARPAIAGAALLVVMETLADFGTVSYFGVETLTTGIYRAWQNMGNLVAAAQLALSLLAIVIAIVWLERRSRERARYGSTRARRSYRVASARGVAAWLRTLLCALPLLLGFVLPVLLLLRLVVDNPDVAMNTKIVRWVVNTVWVGLFAAFVAVAISLWLHAHARLAKNPLAAWVERVLSFGYAVPGAVLAIGILLPLAWFDNRLIDATKALFNWNPGLVFTGSVIALVYASSLRFYGVASTNIAAGYARLPTSLDDSARVLGAAHRETFVRVHWPILRRASLAALLLLFIDTVKELPATLTLRPFNFDTLATVTYNFVKDERLAEAALPSLTIVLVSLPAIWLLARKNYD